MKTRKQQQALTISDSTQLQPPTKTRTTRQPVVMIYQQKQKQPTTTTKTHNQKCRVIIPKLKIPPTNENNQTWDPTQLESEIQDKRQSTKKWVDVTRTYTYPNETNTAPEEEELPEEQLSQPEELVEPEELAEPEELLQPKGVEEAKKAEQKINHEIRRSSSEEEEQERGRPVEEPTQPNIPRSESTLEYLQLPPASSASTSQKTECQSAARDRAHEADCCDTPTNKKRIHGHDHPGSPENPSDRSEPSSDPKKARTTSYPKPSSSKPGPSRLTTNKPSSRPLKNVRRTRPSTPSGYGDEEDPFGFIHAQQVAQPTESISPDTHQHRQHSPPPPPGLPSGDNHNLSDLSLADLLNLPKKSTKQKKNAVSKKSELRKTSSSSYPAHRTRRLPAHKPAKVDILNNHKIIQASSSSNKKKKKKKKEINDENDEVEEQEEELQDLPSSSSSTSASSSFVPGRRGQRRERALKQKTDSDLLSSTDNHSPPPETPTSSASASTRKILRSKENITRPTRSSRRPTDRTLQPGKKTNSLKQKKKEPKKSTQKSHKENGKDARRSKVVSAVSLDPLSSEGEKDRQAARLRYYEALDQIQFEEEIVI